MYSKEKEMNEAIDSIFDLYDMAYRKGYSAGIDVAEMICSWMVDGASLTEIKRWAEKAIEKKKNEELRKFL